MDGRRDPSFLATKKNHAPTRDKEEQSIPEAKESWAYLSMALVLGGDREYRLPRGGVVPGSRSTVQSLGQ